MTTLQLTILQLHRAQIYRIGEWFVCCSDMFTPDAHKTFCTRERQLRQMSKTGRWMLCVGVLYGY